jgi:transposase InsO family protein
VVSKARLVISAVVLEGRSPAEVADGYGVSRSWVYELLARYRVEGEAAFEPRSRRPRSSPAALPEPTVALILGLRTELAGKGLDAGPHTLAWHLEHHHQLKVAPATIWRHLTKHGLIAAQPRKRPKSSYVRFAADLPNQTWQSDFTHYRLTKPDSSPGADVEILTWLDDHSRFALSITAHHRATGPIVLATFRETVASYGIPASTLTDNGMVFTTRLAGGRGGRNGFEAELARLHVTQKNSQPGHPTTCGKVERFQQTMKKWLRARTDQPTTPADLQSLLDTFTNAYNHHRPHRSLEHHATPATAYTARPKATPGTPGINSHDRVRHDRVDNTGCVTLRVHGRLHHIGIGRTHAGTRILLLVHDLDIRIIDAATGELLRELVLDTTKNYQPTGAPKGPTTPRTPRT